MIDRRGVPLRPDWQSYQALPFVARAALACARHALDPLRHGSAEAVAKAAWPGDKATLAVINRAATAPHSTANAAALAVEAVGAFLANLAPISAAASLFSIAPRVTLGENSTVKLPSRADPLAAADCTWVDEGGPSPVVRLDLAGATVLGPARKLLTSVAASRELVESTDAESILDLMLRESASYSLDLAVFSAIAASSARPAGLLAGIAPLTPSAATDKATAMADDMAALGAAVAGNGTGLAYVMHAKQAASVRLRRGSLWDPSIPVWPTIGAAEGVVIALDPAAIVSAFGSDPEVRASRQADYHFEDTSPAQIASGGTISSPVGSLWQTDLVALRLTLRAAWALRAPGAIAWLTASW